MANNPFITYLFSLCDECIRLSAELQTVLKEEKQALIALNTDLILIKVSEKESVFLKLLRKRAELKRLIETQFNAASFDELVLSDPEQQKLWKSKLEQWRSGWNTLQSTCESNQKFIQHSLKNLGLCVDNLKRLFGQHATYSAKGKKVETQSTGKVVEAKV